MSKLRMKTYYGTKVIDSGTTAGDYSLSTPDTTNQRAYTSFISDHTVDHSGRLVGVSKSIEIAADYTLADLRLINRLIGLSVRHNQEDLLDREPLMHIPEHHAPVGGIQETEASASDGMNFAVQDGGRIFMFDEPVQAQGGDRLEIELNVFAAMSGMTGTDDSYVRAIVWQIPDLV